MNRPKNQNIQRTKITIESTTTPPHESPPWSVATKSIVAVVSLLLITLVIWRFQSLIAPLVIDGAINGELFLAYVRQQLAPALQPGDIVVMDNLSSHKRVGVQAAIEAVGASLLYLPPYSPDFNPIELAFAKFKWLLKSAAHRTVDALWQACGELLHQFTATECRNYLRHCGYRYT